MNQLQDLDLNNKKVFIRSDLNVPIKSGQITSTKRIEASLPTITHCLRMGAKVMVTSHLGRPNEGEYNPEFSLLPIVKFLENHFKKKINLIKEWPVQKINVGSGELVVLENCRFNQGESENDQNLAKQYASLADIFVMDAFGTAHRKQASTYGIAQFCDQVCAGKLFSSELEALQKVMSNPKLPMVAIVGGSKVSTKLSILDSLSDKVDQLILGGGIANTFLKAQGFNIGNSLYEKDFIDAAKKIIQKLESRGGSLPLVTDVICAKEFNENETAVKKNINDLESSDMIFDLGPETMKGIEDTIKKSQTILWNGPIGVFEFDQFSKGTETLAHSIANAIAFSLVGGGDTIAALEKFGMLKNMSYISTAGGAFLEFVEGKKLPAIEILEKRSTIEH